MRRCFELSVPYSELKKEGQRECCCNNLAWKESWVKPTELYIYSHMDFLMKPPQRQTLEIMLRKELVSTGATRLEFACLYIIQINLLEEDFYGRNIGTNFSHLCFFFDPFATYI